MTVTTWTQDYPARESSAEAAARHVKRLLESCIPSRADDAHKLAVKLFAWGLARSKKNANLNLITMIDHTPGGLKVRFELHYPFDMPALDTRLAFEAMCGFADAYGECNTRTGRMTYGELWERR
ncbi:hypothetical protein AB0I81_46715 [Nonomuraea sp. NPDC050404]|uniref:hypothetical protein n=1 Tax=Nonomuraea sp. NPDC050404 TaxID=3155783 RepID=UPI0033DDCA79